MIKKIASDLYCINETCKTGLLNLESILQVDDDCIEGFLSCKLCDTHYPIIQGVAILVNDFHKYASQRITTFGGWIVNSKSPEIKGYLRSQGLKIRSPTFNDHYEENNTGYQSYMNFYHGFSADDRLLQLLKKQIKPDNIYKMLSSRSLKLNGVGLDLGCAIGSSTFELSKKLSYVFGIDMSFSFIFAARRTMHVRKSRNIEFIVADAANLPFKSKIFESVVALNIVDRIDLYKLVTSVNGCIKKHGKLILIDPYHFIDNNDRDKFDSVELRKKLLTFGYTTKNKESYIPWIIKINERSYLFYFVDLIEASKID